MKNYVKKLSFLSLALAFVMQPLCAMDGMDINDRPRDKKSFVVVYQNVQHCYRDRCQKEINSKQTVSNNILFGEYYGEAGVTLDCGHNVCSNCFDKLCPSSFQSDALKGAGAFGGAKPDMNYHAALQCPVCKQGCWVKKPRLLGTYQHSLFERKFDKNWLGWFTTRYPLGEIVICLLPLVKNKMSYTRYKLLHFVLTKLGSDLDDHAYFYENWFFGLPQYTQSLNNASPWQAHLQNRRWIYMQAALFLFDMYWTVKAYKK